MPTCERLSAEVWPYLTHAVSRLSGCCLFDVPAGTNQSAPLRVLTALPAREWTLSDAQAPAGQLPCGVADWPAEQPRLDSRRDPAYWLPLRLGFIAYRDGDIALGTSGGEAAATPAVRMSEHDWALVLDRNEASLHVFFHPQCPPARVAQVQRIISQARKDTPRALHAFALQEPFRAHQSREDYLAKLAAIDEYIHAGDVYQVNYAQCFSAPFRGEPMSAYEHLYATSPNPCSVYLDTGRSQILSLSPERFLKVQQGLVETRPIKGTRRRGNTNEEDRQLKQALLDSDKDRAENLMIVDLLRNDLGKCCETGSIEAFPLFELETFSNVHHLVSAVRGRLRSDLTPLELLLSAFPGGSVTGAPKRRAMEIIRELEPEPRDAYCGSFFHWTPGNGFDSTIAIRTLVCHDGLIKCWGGGGIVADSVAEEEYQESITKIRLYMDMLEEL